MTIFEYDVVRVVAQIPTDRVDRNLSHGAFPQIGDVGTVVLAHGVRPPQERSFVVECVGPDNRLACGYLFIGA